MVRDREKLSALRFQIIDIHLTDITKEDLENQLASVAIIFVAGGNSFYLLEKMRESGFDTLILDLVAKGVYYVWSSAWSVVAGLSIEPVKTIDDSTKAPTLENYEWLHLIDAVIVPHAGHLRYGEGMEKIMEEYAYLGDRIVALTDQEAVLVDGEIQEIVSC